MTLYSKAAVGLMTIAFMFVCDAVNAQTRVVSLSQLRAAQAQGRTIRIRRPSRVVARRTPTNTKTSAATKATVENPSVKDNVPQAALQTERGKELADRLRNLRFTESQLGSKHPSLSSVKEEIKSVKEELQAWVPAIKTKKKTDDDKVETVETALAELDEDDLRQLVVRLALDVHKLRSQMTELKTEQKKISGLVVDRK